MNFQLLQFSTYCQPSVRLAQLSSVRSRAGRPLVCRSSQHQHCRARSQLVVQANELNKWANRDGRDEPFGLDEDGHIRDTAAVVLRVLTARSVQVLLMQLQETDVFVAQYLNNFAAENPPSQDKFLNKLFAQPGKAVKDPGTGAIHKIDPQALAHRVLQTREEMARSVMVGFDAFVSQQNTVVLRDYLTNSTFTSGTTEKGYKERRGYYRRRNAKPQDDESEPES